MGTMKFKSFNRVLAAFADAYDACRSGAYEHCHGPLNEEPGIVILDESDLLEAEPMPTRRQNRRRRAACRAGMPTPGAAEIEIKGRPYRHTHSHACRTHRYAGGKPDHRTYRHAAAYCHAAQGFNLMSNNADELTNGGITINISGGKGNRRGRRNLHFRLR